MKVRSTDWPADAPRRVGPIRWLLNAVFGTLAGVLWIAYLAIGSWLMSVFVPVDEGSPRRPHLPDTARDKIRVAQDR
jgi:hypothetical protein